MLTRFALYLPPLLQLKQLKTHWRDWVAWQEAGKLDRPTWGGYQTEHVELEDLQDSFGALYMYEMPKE